MTSTDAYASVRQTLRQELQSRRGQIHAIEAGLSRSEGYLAKVCRGDISIPFEILLKSLELLGTEPRRFFGRALGTALDPTEVLLDVAPVEPDRVVSKVLAEIEKLAAQLSADDFQESHEEISSLLGLDDLRETSTSESRVPRVEIPETSDESVGLANSVLAASVTEQRRRLRSARRYRSAAFARSYLNALENRRQHEPRNVAKLAESVALDLIPQIEAPARERLELLLGAAKAHAAARRAIGNEGAAAALLHGCLQLIEPLQWPAETALLLQRVVTLLTNTGHYRAALVCQERAQSLFAELGRDRDVGRLLFQRAVLHNHTGSAPAMRRTLARALERLGPAREENDPDNLYRVAAFQMLAADFRVRGDLEAATRLLARAVDSLGETSGSHYARLAWERALIEIQLGHPQTANDLLRRCREEFARLEDPAAALVTLDLIDLLLAERRASEAKDLALEMVQCVRQYERHPANEAALMAFLRTVFEGHLDEQLTEALRKSLAAGMLDKSNARRSAKKTRSRRA